MKPNDLVTWTGRNGETRYGKVTSLHGIYARAAENAPLTFVERPVDAQVRGICTLKRLSKQGEK